MVNMLCIVIFEIVAHITRIGTKNRSHNTNTDLSFHELIEISSISILSVLCVVDIFNFTLHFLVFCLPLS